MARHFLNRCIGRATAGGSADLTDTFTFASAITGFDLPNDAANPPVVDGGTYRVVLESDDLTQWTIADCTFDAAGDGTITITKLYDTSSGGSAVTFSAAPKIRLGGPLAQDMVEVLVTDETLPSSGATFDVELSADVFDAYESLTVRASGVTPDTPSTPPAYFGLQVFPTGGSVSTIDLSGFQDLTDEPGAFVRFSLLLAGAAATGFVGLTSMYMASDAGDGPNADLSPTDPQVDDWSPGITMRFLFQDDNGDPVDVVSGRVIVWGRKKP